MASVRREVIAARRQLVYCRGVRPLVVALSAIGCSRIKSSTTAGSLWRVARVRVVFPWLSVTASRHLFLGSSLAFVIISWTSSSGALELQAIVMAVTP